MKRRHSGGRGFASPGKEYSYAEESSFRFSIDKEIGDLKVSVENLKEVSGSSLSKGLIRKNIPFFRASIVDY